MDMEHPAAQSRARPLVTVSAAICFVGGIYLLTKYLTNPDPPPKFDDTDVTQFRELTQVC